MGKFAGRDTPLVAMDATAHNPKNGQFATGGSKAAQQYHKQKAEYHYGEAQKALTSGNKAAFEFHHVAAVHHEYAKAAHKGTHGTRLVEMAGGLSGMTKRADEKSAVAEKVAAGGKAPDRDNLHHLTDLASGRKKYRRDWAKANNVK